MNTETAPEVQMTDAAANPPPSTEQTPMTNDSAQLPSSSLQTTEETEEVRVESAPEVEAEKEVEVEAQAPPAPVSFLTNSGIDKPKTIAPVVEEVAGNDGGDEVTASALSDSTLKGAPKPKKRTAYFIFMDDMRGKAKQNLVDAGQDVTVGDISKELGRLWKALTEEQKKPYEEQSRLEKAQYQSWLSENPLPISGGGDGGGGNVLDVAIPPAKVKRILKMDPDLKQVSKESLALITYATQLFTAYTAQQSYSISTIQNRRKLLPRDLLDACGTREAMAFLREDIRDFVQKVEKEVLVGQKRKNENVEVGAGQAVQQQQFKNFFQSNI